MSLLENDDLPTINPFHVHVREPCFLGCDPNFKLQVCNEVLWTLRKSSAKEIATCSFNCLWELGFRLADDGEKRVLKSYRPKRHEVPENLLWRWRKRARQERRSQWFTILVSPNEFSSLPWNELRSLREESKRLTEENEQLSSLGYRGKCEGVVRSDETLQQQLTELKSNGKEQQQAHRGRDYSRELKHWRRRRHGRRLVKNGFKFYSRISWVTKPVQSVNLSTNLLKLNM